MKTAVSMSSIKTFDAMQGAGFEALQALILSNMRAGQIYSRRQLAMMTGIETSSVSGRVNRLIELDAIVECGSIKCPITNREVHGIKRADEQLELLA